MIEIDGGVNQKNAADCIKAGVNNLVAGSAIFSHPADERGKVIKKIRG
jgi:pentose-5-phosphate-3-epimerase